MTALYFFRGRSCFMTNSRTRGFTLAELAIVLVVVSLILGGIIVPLAAQIGQQRVRDAQKQLEDIKEALLGFALVNGRLPRPAQSATNGAERSDCGSGAAGEINCTGFVPWEVLGTPKLDPWGKIYRYSVTPGFANAPFNLTTTGSKTVRTRDQAPPNNLINMASGVAAVIWSHGNRNWGTEDGGNALADSSATNIDEDSNNQGLANAGVVFISRQATERTDASGGEFDDAVTWLSANVLFSRMVAAGRLQ
jgi:prepilin-type N-terminal cleavage/methylation domain-containing protein